MEAFNLDIDISRKVVYSNTNNLKNNKDKIGKNNIISFY